ncbi:MAG TPA: dipeptidase [Flavisolibacter sp.]|nr:dipeptidase [Flavisolibacter sp.]
MTRFLGCMLLLCLALSSEAQAYRRLHKKAIVVDTHNDVLSTVTMRGLNFDADLSGKSHSDLDRLKKGGVDVQVFSIFCDERFGKDTAFAYANREIDSLMAIIGRNRERMMLVTSPAELERAVTGQKLGCMLGVEGGHMIEDRLDYLDSFFRRGVRYLTLTWNNSTSWASSAKDEHAFATGLAPAGPAGLTAFGKTVVQRMNALGMLVDLSHVGEKTFWDVMNLTAKPVIASHSCAYSLCPVPRNLKDDQIRAIAKNGGVIHLNFYSGFIDSNYQKSKAAFMDRHRAEADSLKAAGMPGWEREEWLAEKYPLEAEAYRPSLDQLLDHIDHIVKLTGTAHVGLGSDFDGIESTPRPLNDVTSFPLLTKALRKRGYSKSEVRDILGGNFIRVWKANQ